MRATRVSFILLLLGLVSFLSHAQAPGNLVRFKTTASRGYLKGTLNAWSQDSLVVTLSTGEDRQLSFGELTRLQYRPGKRPRIIKIVILGTASGFALGFPAGIGLNCSVYSISCSVAITTLQFGAIFAVPSALLSFAVALVFKGERWKTVRKTPFTAGWSANGIGVRIRFRP